MRHTMRNPYISIGQPAGSKKFNNINGCHGNDLTNAYCLGIVFHVRIVSIYSYVS